MERKLLKKFFWLLTIFLVVSGVFLVFNFSWAQDASNSASNDFGVDLAQDTGLGGNDLITTVLNIIRIALGLIGLLAVIFIIYAGYLWLSAGGNPEQVEKAKKIIKAAVIGLVIILSAFTIVSFIINQMMTATGAAGGDGGCVGDDCGCVGDSCGCVGADCGGDLNIPRAYPNILKDSQLNWQKILGPSFSGAASIPASANLQIGAWAKNPGGAFAGLDLEAKPEFGDFALISVFTNVPNDQEVVTDTFASWDTSGYGIGNYYLAKIKATPLGELASVFYSNDLRTVVRPLHCFNNQKDEDETDIDCGGECGACAGESCGSGCLNDNCASGLCLADGCVCAALPRISQVLPDNGAPQNYITLSGQDFGQEQGRVIFLQGDIIKGEASFAFPADCPDVWENNQIIFIVPELAAGAYKLVVVSDNGLASQPVDFTINDIIRPGICNVANLTAPEKGAAGQDGEQIRATGNQFPLTSEVGALIWNFKVWNQNSNSWEEDPLTSQNVSWLNVNQANDLAPANRRGRTSLQVKVNSSNELSNPYRFLISAGGEGDPCGDAGEGACSAAEVCSSGLVCRRGDCTCQRETGSSLCGNDQIDAGEACDGLVFRLDNQCASHGNWQSGQISCQSDCQVNTAGCVARPVVEKAASQAVYGWGFYNISGQVIPETTLCGNNQLDSGEACDGSLFSFGDSCASYGGWLSGTVTCKNNCQINTQNCVGSFIPENSANQAIYGWAFNFSASIVPDLPVPQVIEDCSRSRSCQAGAKLPSPTPWSEGWNQQTSSNLQIENPLACLNAVILARFSVAMDVSSLNLENIKVLKCADVDGNNCSAVSGTILVRSDNSGKNNDYFRFIPATDLAANSWYKVILRSGVRSDQGVSFNLTRADQQKLDQRKCNVSGVTDAVYCWNFQTRASNNDCQPGCVECSPDPHWFNYAGQSFVYNADVDSEDNVCLLLRPSDFNWQWSVNKTDKFSLNSQTGAEISATALGETIFDSGENFARIIAKLTSHSDKEDYCRAYGDFTNPAVIEDASCRDGNIQSPSPWQGSENNCLNSLMAARFSKDMDDSTINSNTVLLNNCGADGNNCSAISYQNITLFDYSFGEAINQELILSGAINNNLPEGFYITPNNLAPNTWYEVVIKGGNSGVRGVGANGNRVGSLANGNCGENNQDYCWRFKIGNTNCAVDKVLVAPADHYMKYTDETQIYNALVQASNCNLLNPNSFSWQWSALMDLNDSVAGGGAGIEVARICDRSAGSCPAYSNPSAPVVKVFAQKEGEVKIKAKAQGAELTDDKWGYGNLQIGFGQLRLSQYLPKKVTCANYEDGAEETNLQLNFNLDIDATTIIPSGAGANIKLYQCSDNNCSVTETTPTVALTRNNSTARSRELTLSPGQLADGLYRVLIKGGPAGPKAFNGNPLTNLNYRSYGVGAGEECEPHLYPWNNYNDLCVNEQNQHCLLNSEKDLCVLANGSFAQCQNFLGGSSADYCDDLCHNTGNSNRSACGNGVVEADEECDDGNIMSGDGCGFKCLWEGANERWGSLCGNGRVEYGEACDGSSDCSSRCLLLNNSKIGSQPANQCSLTEGFNINQTIGVNGDSIPFGDNDALISYRNLAIGNSVLSTWGIRNSQVLAQSNGGSSVIMKDGRSVGGQHYLAKARMIISGNADKVGLAFGYQNQNSYLIFYRQSDGALALADNSGVLNQTVSVFAAGDLTIEVVNGQNSATINGYYNNQIVLSENLNRRVIGNVGLYAAGNVADTSFDNFELINFDRSDIGWCANFVATPVCGNGQKEIGEDCDDGNTTGSDGCGATCLNEGSVNAWCGNDVVETGQNDSYSWTFGVDNSEAACEAANPGSVSLGPCANGIWRFKFKTVNPEGETINSALIKVYKTTAVAANNSWWQKAKNLVKKMFGQGVAAENWGEPIYQEQFDGLATRGSIVKNVSIDGGNAELIGYSQKQEEVVYYTLNYIKETSWDINAKYKVEVYNVQTNQKIRENIVDILNAPCRLNDIQVEIWPWGEEKDNDTFFCAHDNCPFDQANSLSGNQHLIRAWALSRDGYLLKSDVTWQAGDLPAYFSLTDQGLGSAYSGDQYITGGANEGRSTLIVKAQSPDLGEAEKPVLIRIFPCVNPWPLPENFPYQDSSNNCQGAVGCLNTNFETYYCRDGGQPDISDDLPALSQDVVVLGPQPSAQEGNIVKEFLFKQEDKPTNVVGLRVAKNNDYLSPRAWYQNNFSGNQQGSPKDLLVDEYQAIEDGRTIYVGAADLTDTMHDVFSDVYLISYNEDADENLINIYKQMVKNLHFNAGSVNNGGLPYSGVCSGDGAYGCFTNSECQAKGYGYCLADKTKLTRDLKRLTDLQAISSLLKNYYQNKRCSNDFNRPCSVDAQCYGGAVCGSYYPALKSGSYIAGRSFSVWPSWQSTLANDLGQASAVDPINKLTGCASPYEETTCWDNDAKQFACAALQDLSNYDKSFVYIYLAQTPGLTDLTNTYQLLAHGEFNPAITVWKNLPATLLLGANNVFNGYYRFFLQNSCNLSF